MLKINGIDVEFGNFYVVVIWLNGYVKMFS